MVFSNKCHATEKRERNPFNIVKGVLLGSIQEMALGKKI
jgi:hypothetical protein